MPIYASKDLIDVYKVEIDGIVYSYGEKIIVDTETLNKRVKYGWYVIGETEDFISTRELMKRVRKAEKSQDFKKNEIKGGLK